MVKYHGRHYTDKTDNAPATRSEVVDTLLRVRVGVSPRGRRDSVQQMQQRGGRMVNVNEGLPRLRVLGR